MLLASILILLVVRPMSQWPFNMYDTDQDSNDDGHCLLYYAIDMGIRGKILFRGVHQIIPYCLRPSEEMQGIFNASLNNNTTDAVFNFDELREKNINSQLLLSWSAPIDVVDTLRSIFWRNFPICHSKCKCYSTTVHYHGLDHSVGFSFDKSADPDLSLDDIVRLNFRRAKLLSSNNVPCYVHLACKTTFLCLDWREICDRKIELS